MERNPLKIASVEQQQIGVQPEKSSKELKRQAEFERGWQRDPEQFNPHRNCMEKERLARTTFLITAYKPVPTAVAVDLGSGYGELTSLLSHLVKTVWAVDISSLALMRLDKLPKETVIKRREALPCTDLPDRYFDLVLCTDVIGYLHEKEQRPLFAELARICKKGGVIICSTPLDIYTEGALERFMALAETELEIKQHLLSYHRLWIRLHDILEGPKRRLAKKSRWRFLHKLLLPISNALLKALLKNQRCLLLLERISKAVWYENGISHIIIAATPKELVPASSTDSEGPAFRPKRRVWE